MNKSLIQIKYLSRLFQEYVDKGSSKALCKKIVNVGVRYVNKYSKEVPYAVYNGVEQALSQLTPNEIQTIFPITKEYDGERYERKDYFYTKKYIAGNFIENQPIGSMLNDFLWEYHNLHLRIFTVGALMALKRELTDEQSEEFNIKTFSMLSIPDSAVHHIVDDDDGHKMLTDRDGNFISYIKPVNHKQCEEEKIQRKINKHRFNKMMSEN